MKKRAVVWFLLLPVLQGLQAQRITNVIPEAVGSKIIVRYDIENSNPDQLFEVALYFSKDNYSTTLQNVSGNGVGSSVSMGKDRVIIWDVLKDVKELTGEYAFEVRALMKSRVVEVVTMASARDHSVNVSNKDDAFPLISNTLTDYINEAKDFKDAFQMLGVQSTESRQALAKLTDAAEQYNRAFEKLNKERLTYEKYVSTFWESPVKTLEFKSLLDYALGDLHGVNILTLNQELVVINDIANGRVKHISAQKKELEKDISEEVLKLDKRLQELERRTNRILYDLSQD
jgi:hypothetical protein